MRFGIIANISMAAAISITGHVGIVAICERLEQILLSQRMRYHPRRAQCVGLKDTQTRFLVDDKNLLPCVFD
jgi:hypothetical protein